MILNAFLLFTLFGNEQKLNCLFIYFSYHVPRYFTSQKKIATSPNNFVGRKLFSKVNTRTINYNSLREQLAVSSGL